MPFFMLITTVGLKFNFSATKYYTNLEANLKKRRQMIPHLPPFLSLRKLKHIKLLITNLTPVPCRRKTEYLVPNWCDFLHTWNKKETKTLESILKLRQKNCTPFFPIYLILITSISNHLYRLIQAPKNTNI